MLAYRENNLCYTWPWFSDYTATNLVLDIKQYRKIINMKRNCKAQVNEALIKPCMKAALARDKP